MPFALAGGCGDAIGIQLISDGRKAVTGKEPFINPFYGDRLIGIDLRLAVRTFAVAQEVFVVEGYISFLCALRLAPPHIGADVLRFALSDGPVDCIVTD